MEPKFLKIREVAELLNVSNQTVWRLVVTGDLPSIRVGAQYRISNAALETYLENANVRIP